MHRKENPGCLEKYISDEYGSSCLSELFCGNGDCSTSEMGTHKVCLGLFALISFFTSYLVYSARYPDIIDSLSNNTLFNNTNVGNSQEEVPGMAFLWVAVTIISYCALVALYKFTCSNRCTSERSQVDAALSDIIKKAYHASSHYMMTHKPQVIGFALTAALLITLSALLIPETERHETHIVVIAALGILACSVAAGAAAKKATQTFFHRRPLFTVLHTDVNIEAAIPLISKAKMPGYGTRDPYVRRH